MISKKVASTNKITVTAKTLKGITGYQFRYATNKNFTGAKVKATKAPTYQFNASAGKTYYVAVRGYAKVGKTTYYGKWSKTTTVSMKKPDHTHSWTPVTKTVHHDEVGHYETIVIEEAYDEPVYESHAICGGCNKDFGVGDAAVEAWDEHSWEQVDAGNIACQNYHTENRQVGTKHYDAVTEQKWVVDQKAYDETVTTGYKCSCGATK